MSVPPPMDGVYNVPADPGEPYPHYQTVAELPSEEEFCREAEILASQLRSRVKRFLAAHEIPEHNEVLDSVFGKYAIGEFPSDRTMCFYIGDLRAFTPELVAVLQEEVLRGFPLWRLLAQFEERSIGIYPDAAWFSQKLIRGKFDEKHPVYRKWYEEASSYREVRFGPLSRQIAYVRNHLPIAIEAAREEGYCCLGAFDKYQPDFDGMPVWILQRGNREFTFDDTSTRVRKSAVSEDAQIYPEFCEAFYPTTDVQPAFWLTTLLVNDFTQRQLTVKSKDGTVVGTVEWSGIVANKMLS